MTSSIEYLYETISRRIARGAIARRDVHLLHKLMVRHRRHWLTKGILIGASAAFALELLVPLMR